jgi:shikimate kinase
MRIFLAGVSCVGKTTIGARLAGLLEYRFFDLDVEIERFFGTSIERLRSRYLTSHDFRLAASQALKDILSREDSCNCVIALPPSGLLGGYWKIVAGHETPPLSRFGILARIFLGESRSMISTPAWCQ